MCSTPHQFNFFLQIVLPCNVVEWQSIKRSYRHSVLGCLQMSMRQLYSKTLMKNRINKEVCAYYLFSDRPVRRMRTVVFSNGRSNVGGFTVLVAKAYISHSQTFSVGEKQGNALSMQVLADLFNVDVIESENAARATPFDLASLALRRPLRPRLGLRLSQWQCGSNFVRLLRGLFVCYLDCCAWWWLHRHIFTRYVILLRFTTFILVLPLPPETANAVWCSSDSWLAQKMAINHSLFRTVTATVGRNLCDPWIALHNLWIHTSRGNPWIAQKSVDRAARSMNFAYELW